MCQRPAFLLATPSVSSLADNRSVAPCLEERSVALLKTRTMGPKTSSPGKRVRFQDPAVLNSFSEPTYTLNEESKHSLWWSREELTPLMVMKSSSPSSSQKSTISPSVSLCLAMFMVSNLSILSIAACFLALDD